MQKQIELKNFKYFKMKNVAGELEIAVEKESKVQTVYNVFSFMIIVFNVFFWVHDHILYSQLFWLIIISPVGLYIYVLLRRLHQLAPIARKDYYSQGPAWWSVYYFYGTLVTGTLAFPFFMLYFISAFLEEYAKWIYGMYASFIMKTNGLLKYYGLSPTRYATYAAKMNAKVGYVAPGTLRLTEESEIQSSRSFRQALRESAMSNTSAPEACQLLETSTPETTSSVLETAPAADKS